MECIQNSVTGARLLWEERIEHPIGNMIILAGGAYMWLSPREQWPVARDYAKAGYQCYVLEYTVGMEHAPLGLLPLRQLAFAVSTVKIQAKKNGTPTFTAVCGFSAGGHLAATLGVHWNDEKVFPKEVQEHIRPDALVLSYGATDLHHFEGQELLQCLCGDDRELYEYLNLKQHITSAVPPTFLWHTVSDEAVSVQASIDFLQELIRAGVYAELHLFPKGVHGLSLATPEVDDPAKNRFADAHVARWMELSQEWLLSVPGHETQ